MSQTMKENFLKHWTPFLPYLSRRSHQRPLVAGKRLQQSYDRQKLIISSIDTSIKYEITLGDDSQVKALGKGIVYVLTKQN